MIHLQAQKAAVGESYADLEKRLLIELQDVEFVRKYTGLSKKFQASRYDMQLD